MISTIYTGTYREPEWKELKHWGIKGMKWGVRRYQNEDGTLTPEGKRRYTTKENFTNEQERRSADRLGTLLATAGAAGVSAGISGPSAKNRAIAALIGGAATLGTNAALDTIRRNKRLGKFRDDTFFNEMKKDKKFMKAYESRKMENYQKSASNMADKLGKKYGYGNPFGMNGDKYSEWDPKGRFDNNILNQKYMDRLLYERSKRPVDYSERKFTAPLYYETQALDKQWRKQVKKYKTAGKKINSKAFRDEWYNTVVKNELKMKRKDSDTL